MSTDVATRNPGSDKISNISPRVGARFDQIDNKFDLWGMDHFALTTKNVAEMEKFVREMLGGEPYYYAGFDESDRKMGRKPHMFIRIGNVLLQCTEEMGPSYPQPEDNNISPHWSFGTTPEGLDQNLARLKAAGIPVAGPYRHKDVDAVSIYFKTPEGHKLEICTWAAYPEEKSKLLGAPEVGPLNWTALNHSWPNKS